MHLEPSPRALPRRYKPYVWPAGEKLLLTPREQILVLDLCALLENRQSRRAFKSVVDNSVLGDFLWLACRNRSSRPSPFGPDQESRVYPSAGAMHPIHVLLARSGGPWLRYDVLEHALIELLGSTDSAAQGRAAAHRLLELDQAVLIGLLAEPGKTAAKYENPETLVWRDAGVVLGYMSVVAEALDLNFCPLGISGFPHLADFLPETSALQAVGLAVLGIA